MVNKYHIVMNKTDFLVIRTMIKILSINSIKLRNVKKLQQDKLKMFLHLKNLIILKQRTLMLRIRKRQLTAWTCMEKRY